MGGGSSTTISGNSGNVTVGARSMHRGPGVFVAPSDGHYYFKFSQSGEQPAADLKLIKNGSPITKPRHSGSQDDGENAVVLELKKGDQVNLSREESGQVSASDNKISLSVTPLSDEGFLFDSLELDSENKAVWLKLKSPSS